MLAPLSDSTPSLPLRPVAPAELARLEALVNSAYRGDASRAGWTTEADLLGGQRTDTDSLAAFIASPERTILVAERGTEFVSCVSLERRAAREVQLGMLTVSPRLQGQGAGSALLSSTETYARDVFSAQSMRMTVIAQRSELLAWYGRRGYRPSGETEPFPYGDPRYGLPRRPDLYFVVLTKTLHQRGQS